MTRVRNFEDVRFGEYLIKTWYYSPYPKPVPIEDRAVSPLPPSTTGVGLGHTQKKRKLEVESHVDTFLSGSRKDALGTKGIGGLKKERSVQDIYAASMGKNADGTRGRLWVCDVSSSPPTRNMV